jgi:type 1 glutamine amidotransferase
MIPAIAFLAIASTPKMNVLVFSKTAGFRHDCIETGHKMFDELGAQNGFTVTDTEDASVFTPYNLKKYNAVVFLCTTGDVLNDGEQNALQAWVESGGGWIGIHSAADTEYDWPWYGKLVGAWFLSHPAIQNVEVRNEDPTNALFKMWGSPTFHRTDEWYDFRTNPRPNVHVLASLNKASYQGSKMEGDDHPIVWCHDMAQGRSFYSGFGHTKETYAEAPFRAMMVAALRWVTRS